MKAILILLFCSVAVAGEEWVVPEWKPFGVTKRVMKDEHGTSSSVEIDEPLTADNARKITTIAKAKRKAELDRQLKIDINHINLSIFYHAERGESSLGYDLTKYDEDQIDVLTKDFENRGYTVMYKQGPQRILKLYWIYDATPVRQVF